MKYEEYIDEVTKLPIGEDIEGYFEFFDPRIHMISKNKLIFILPNGKCLFMPYAQGDKGTRKQGKYTHRKYIIIALRNIINELNNSEKEFIEANIETLMRDDIIIALMKQGVSLLYDCGKRDGNGKLKSKRNRYSIFCESEELTETQKKTLLRMKGNLEKEKYKMMICKLFKDLDNSDYYDYITDEDTNNDEFEIDKFYQLLGLQEEKVQDKIEKDVR